MKRLQSFRYSFARMRLGVTLIPRTVEVHKILWLEELLRFFLVNITWTFNRFFYIWTGFRISSIWGNIFFQSILVDALGSKASRMKQKPRLKRWRSPADFAAENTAFIDEVGFVKCGVCWWWPRRRCLRSEIWHESFVFFDKKEMPRYLFFQDVAHVLSQLFFGYPCEAVAWYVPSNNIPARATERISDIYPRKVPRIFTTSPYDLKGWGLGKLPPPVMRFRIDPIPSLKLTVWTPENRPKPKRKGASPKVPLFQGQTVCFFRECKSSLEF